LRLLVLITQSLKLTLAREIPLSRTSYNLLGVASFTALTALGAFVWIPLPFTPIPITLQTFFVLLGGAILGRRLGVLSQLLYIGLGGLGLPIFAGFGGGLPRLVGPAGGYYIGFVLAAYLVGRMAKKKKANLWSLMLIMGVGEGIILFLGTLWLTCVLRIGIGQGLYLGLIPFLPGDMVKLAAAASVCYGMQSKFTTSSNKQ
jgi:biotin transport system substrate-specific component